MVPTLALLQGALIATGMAGWEPLIQFGIAGVVLGWFMFMTEPRLRAMEASIDRMARSVLMLVIALPHATEATKSQAHGIIAELDEAARQRGANK